MDNKLFKKKLEKGTNVREDNGIRYIEKKEVIEHEKYGKGVLFFQKQIKINSNIVSELTLSEFVEFENKKFKIKEIYKNGKLIKSITNDKEKELITEESENILGYKVIVENNENSGIRKETLYNKSGTIEYIKEKDFSKKTITQYNEDGSIWYIKENDKKLGIKKTTYYENSGNISLIIEENKKLGIEKTTYYEDSKFKNILRKTKNLGVSIEEYFEEGKILPIFKIDNIEVPLMNTEQYKEKCIKYKIEPLTEILQEYKNSIIQKKKSKISKK